MTSVLAVASPQAVCAQDRELLPLQMPTFGDCFPGSEKVFREITHNGEQMKIPMRRVHLSGGSGHLDLQDTSGTQVRSCCAPSFSV